MSDLTKLQESTKKQILNAFLNQGRKKYLLADETGLGKTRIAEGVIKELARKKGKDPFVVYYLCGNQRVVVQNMNSLIKHCDAVETSTERLSMQGDSIAEYKQACNKNGKANIIILALTPATTFTNINSSYEQTEAKYYTAHGRNVGKKEENINTRGKSEFLKAREAFCRAIMESELPPDLVILDEFQNYTGLLEKEENTATGFKYELFGILMKKAAHVLLLSATPYEMRPKEVREMTLNENIQDSDKKINQEEEDENKEFSGTFTFSRMVEFILETKEEYEQYLGLNERKAVEKYLYENILCRTERIEFYGTEIKKDVVDEVELGIEDIPSDFMFQKKVKENYDSLAGKMDESARVNTHIAFTKKAPQYPNFATRYKSLKYYINDEDFLKEKENKIALGKIRKETDPFCHGKLKALRNFCAPAGIEALLWIPPVIFKPQIGNERIETHNPFFSNSKFTKTLVFCDFRMSTAAPVFFISEDMRVKQSQYVNKDFRIPDVPDIDWDAYYNRCISFRGKCEEKEMQSMNEAWEAVLAYVENLLKSNVELIRRVTNISNNDEKAKKVYCVMGDLYHVLEEYWNVLLKSGTGSKKSQKRILKGKESFLEYEPTKIICFPDRVEEKNRGVCGFAERFTNDNTDTNAHDSTRFEVLQRKFNSPFYPFVMTAASTAQEGLDFHYYCHATAHWSIPKTPIEYEQKEGRIDRYYSHLVRKRLYALFDDKEYNTMQELFSGSEKYVCDERPLFPYWYVGKVDVNRIKPEGHKTELTKFKRLVCAYPLSREYMFYKKLQRALTEYNAVLGPSYQTQGKSLNLCPYLRNNM